MFATNDPALHEHVLTLSNHGRAPGQSKQFWPDTLGYKYKMSNLQAAIGCAQIERIDALIEGKRRVFQAYAAELAGLPLSMNPEPEGTSNGYWMPTIVVDEGVPFDRSALIEEFRANGIDGRVFFWPLSMLPMFERVPANTVSYGLFERAVNLPSYHDLRDDEIARVASIVRRRIG
jgi:perosamine synthetase